MQLIVVRYVICSDISWCRFCANSPIKRILVIQIDKIDIIFYIHTTFLLFLASNGKENEVFMKFGLKLAP
jgi:hypothetical protein